MGGRQELITIRIFGNQKILTTNFVAETQQDVDHDENWLLEFLVRIVKEIPAHKTVFIEHSANSFTRIFCS